ncbi:sterol desaturase family protein [Streptomyces sp. NPDC090127]|uniref:sterol desaturase family protein n=1 Tax=Streptomyces sp. NPDC090127 TaxID=3365953 RepID=UPI00382AE7ED
MYRLSVRDALAVTAQPVLLFQFTVLGWLVQLEFLIPYDRSWQPDRREWGWYGVYHVLTAVGGTVGQGYVAHANIRVRLGPLDHVLSGPEQHRLHHSTDLSEAGHYGSDLSVWDRVFSTFTWRPGREPESVGLTDPDSFPATGAVLATLVHPWRRSVG